MKRLIVVAAAVAFAFPATAAPIDGVWKIDLKSAQVNTTPRAQSIVNGMYDCITCKPRFSVRADGKFHPVAGHPGLDSESVRVVDARTVTIEDMKGGHMTGSDTQTVSPDGKTLDVSWKNIGANGKVVTGHATEVRVAPGPKGAHMISGSWKSEKVDNIDEAGLTINMKEAGGMLHVSYPTGEGFDARIGGPSVPIRGDLAGTMASVKRTGPQTFVETDTVKGKVVTVTTFTLAGPNTLKFASEDRVHGGVTRALAHK